MPEQDTNRRSRRLRLAGILAILTAAALALGGAALAGDWSGKEETRDGVVHVMNPAKPMEKPVTLEPEEAWRLGGEEDEEIFGVITDIIADDAGNFYFLDAQLNEIKIYASDGEYLRTIGRAGEGPGEWRGGFNIFLVPGGNIGVLQAFPSKVIVLTPEGEPGGDFPLPETDEEGFRALIAAEYAGKNLALIWILQQPSESAFTRKTILSFVDSGAQKETRLYSQDSTMTMAAAVISETEWDSFNNRWTASSDGRAFACTEFGKYTINVWGPDGKLERVIHRAYPDHARSAEETERILGIYKGFTRQIPLPNIQYELEESWNPIQQIYARDDGTLWVLTSRGSYDKPDGIIGVFDVFDKKGRFVKQVSLKGEGDSLNDGYFFVKDRLFVITDFLPALMALQGGGSGEEEEAEDEPELMQILSYVVK